MVQHAIETTKTIDWKDLIPEQDWELYKNVIKNFRAQSIRFAIGGGLAFSEYAHRLRNTKDLDLYILPEDREAAIQQLLAAGFEDYYPVHEYDRSWIFRGHRGNVIVDIIWTTPNHRMDVDPRWLNRGRDIDCYGTRLKLIPPEELVWAKLFVLQRDRSDWPDLLNIIDSIGPTMDWRHLIDRAGPDVPLLGALLAVYRWLNPLGAQRLPVWLWERVGLQQSVLQRLDEPAKDRAFLLDSREWFGPKETL